MAAALGALMTVAPRVWYAPYLVHHPAGLTPLRINSSQAC